MMFLNTPKAHSKNKSGFKQELQHKVCKPYVDKPLDLADDLVWCSHQISLDELPC